MLHKTCFKKNWGGGIGNELHKMLFSPGVLIGTAETLKIFFSPRKPTLKGHTDTNGLELSP